MILRIRLIDRFWSLAVIAVLMSVGCHAPLRGQAAGMAPATVSSLPQAGLSMGLGWNSPAPSERGGPALPPLPEHPPLPPVQSSGVSSQAFLPPAKSVSAASAATTTNVSPATGETCLPDQQQWREKIEEQTTTLQQQTSQLQQDLLSTREQLEQVKHDLEASHQEIRQLKESVSYWQAEVKRLEAESQAQQQADLKSLDELSASLSQLVGAQRSRHREARK
jgi:hypothetical protein